MYTNELFNTHFGILTFYSDCTRAENCTSNGNCALNGSCSCDGGFDGTGCGECATNYYAYPACKCILFYYIIFLVLFFHCFSFMPVCTRNNTCHTHGNCSAAGTCNCDDGFDVNFSCGRCSADHYNYPNCVGMFISLKKIFISN